MLPLCFVHLSTSYNDGNSFQLRFSASPFTRLSMCTIFVSLSLNISGDLKNIKNMVLTFIRLIIFKDIWTKLFTLGVTLKKRWSSWNNSTFWKAFWEIRNVLYFVYVRSIEFASVVWKPQYQEDWENTKYFF